MGYSLGRHSVCLVDSSFIKFSHKCLVMKANLQDIWFTCYNNSGNFQKFLEISAILNFPKFLRFLIFSEIYITGFILDISSILLLKCQ